MSLAIEGKIALVTGAGRGIGRAIILQLARAGASVVAAARTAEQIEAVAKEIAGDGGRAVAIRTDLAQDSDICSLFDRIRERFGRLDVLVNNAGLGLFGPVEEFSAADFDRLVAVNLRGPFLCCQQAMRMMIPQGSGHIFNVSSVIGRVGSPFHGSYSASKFALSGLTEAMRVELRPFGIHVTEVCPALTATEFSDHVLDGSARDKSEFLRKQKAMPAKTVAERMVRRTGKRTCRLIFTIGGRFLATLAAVWPRASDRLLKIYHDQLAKSFTPPDQSA